MPSPAKFCTVLSVLSNYVNTAFCFLLWESKAIRIKHDKPNN